MYKITSDVFGELRINNRILSYKESMTVAQLDDKITNMQENKLIKVIEITDKPKTKIQSSDLFTTTSKDEKLKKKKNI